MRPTSLTAARTVVRDRRSSKQNDPPFAGFGEHLMTLTRRCALGLVACAVLFSGAASAQEFPTRVIKMVVPYPAGGPTDAIARIVAEEMGKSLGQNVVVENIAGASGAIGTR